VNIDPSGHLLSSFIDLTISQSRFSPEERRHIGVRTCPGNDLDSTHSARMSMFVRTRHGAGVKETVNF
jgi:hypothetical protein